MNVGANILNIRLANLSTNIKMGFWCSELKSQSHTLPTVFFLNFKRNAFYQFLVSWLKKKISKPYAVIY